jgi:hypothetical protein
MWTGLKWLRMESIGGFMVTAVLKVVSHKFRDKMTDCQLLKEDCARWG